MESTTKRRGRPSKGRTPITVHLDPEALRRLDAYAARTPEHDGRGDAISALVLDTITQTGRRRNSS